jgi:hypothetical protein
VRGVRIRWPSPLGAFAGGVFPRRRFPRRRLPPSQAGARPLTPIRKCGAFGSPGLRTRRRGTHLLLSCLRVAITSSAARTRTPLRVARQEFLRSISSDPSRPARRADRCLAAVWLQSDRSPAEWIRRSEPFCLNRRMPTSEQGKAAGRFGPPHHITGRCDPTMSGESLTKFVRHMSAEAFTGKPVPPKVKRYYLEVGAATKVLAREFPHLSWKVGLGQHAYPCTRLLRLSAQGPRTRVQLNPSRSAYPTGPWADNQIVGLIPTDSAVQRQHEEKRKEVSVSGRCCTFFRVRKKKESLAGLKAFQDRCRGGTPKGSC